MLYTLARPAIFALDAEAAHRLTVSALRLAPRLSGSKSNPRLAIQVAGLDFPSPVGLAAGFDKNAEAADALFGFGFGFVEVGTITPKPQAGNPRPRLFRLVEDNAVINRMGFNNDGAVVVSARLARRDRDFGLTGINIGANKDSVDRIADYAEMTRIMAPLADYLTVNISSPNTPGLRALQDPAALAGLIDVVQEARGSHAAPIFLKLAPDLEPADIDDICKIAIDKRLDALIISNTTISRPDLRSRHAGEAGGLSGEPLHDLALACLRDFRRASGGAVPLIGVGGIANADQAYQRIKAGASLVQIYSALVYEGPALAAKINKGLLKLLDEDGLTKLSEAIGVDD